MFNIFDFMNNEIKLFKYIHTHRYTEKFTKEITRVISVNSISLLIILSVLSCFVIAYSIISYTDLQYKINTVDTICNYMKKFLIIIFCIITTIFLLYQFYTEIESFIIYVSYIFVDIFMNIADIIMSITSTMIDIIIDICELLSSKYSIDINIIFGVIIIITGINILIYINDIL